MKQIVLTGATRGLGRALVRWFAENGCIVHGCGRSEESVEELRRLHPAHTFHAVDVSDDEAVREWAREILRCGAVPDLLINNAATIAPNAPLWTLSAKEVERVFRVNVQGTVHTIRHFTPAMIRSGRGVIINFSSGWGRSTSPEVAAYCASKWAIEGLTQALSQELPEGLAAAALNPGIIDTEMLRECFGDSAGAYPSPSEWAQCAGPFLLSLDARCNGRQLTVPSIPTE